MEERRLCSFACLVSLLLMRSSTLAELTPSWILGPFYSGFPYGWKVSNSLGILRVFIGTTEVATQPFGLNSFQAFSLSGMRQSLLAYTNSVVYSDLRKPHYSEVYPFYQFYSPGEPNKESYDWQSHPSKLRSRGRHSGLKKLRNWDNRKWW